MAGSYDSHDSSTIQDLLQRLVKVIQTSTVINAEEREKDEPSTYWTAYKKVADRWDDKMLERCNANMDMVLVAAGLCSAVNATFIATMQPSAVDTTNALLSQLIQISLQDSSTTQPIILSSSTTFGFWTQMLAYSSLLFSLLAAFGAIMGKYWLGHYKTNRYGRGTREERCKQRHHKFQQLEMWQFENVLQSFTVILYISLGLFVMFLGAAMWTQDRAISILSIGGASFVMFSYSLCSCLPVIYPDCPFQTPNTQHIRGLVRRFHTPSCRRRNDDNDDDLSTTFWILNTSTDLDVLKTASKFIMTIKHIDSSALDQLCQTMFKRLRKCFGTNRTFQHDALVYGEVLLHIYLNEPSARPMLCKNTNNWTDWKSWRDLYLPRALRHYHEMLKSDHADLQQHQRAQEGIRNALRTVVATGSTGFIDPDDENLAREDSSHLGFYLLDVDVDVARLTDCATRFFNAGDFIAARYPLFLLSGVLKKSLPSIQCVAPFLDKKLDHRLRAMVLRVARVIALGAACALDYKDSKSLCDDSFSNHILSAICPCPNRDDKDLTDVMSLLKFDEWPAGRDLEFCTLHDIQLLALLVLPTPDVNSTSYIPYYEALICFMDSRQPGLDVIRHIAIRKAYNVRHYLPESLRSKLSPALITLLDLDGEQSDKDFYCYVRLIFSLAKRSDWRLYLEEDIHVKWIGIVQDLIQKSSDGRNKPSPCLFYIAGILLHIFHPQQSSSHSTAISPNQWWNLMIMAWRVAGDSYDQCYNVLDDGVEMLKPLATETERCMPGDASMKELKPLHQWLDGTVDKLSQRSDVHYSIVSTVKGLRRMVFFKIVQRQPMYFGFGERFLV